MQSNKVRLRKEYAPLTVAQSIRCITPASPTTQIYNGANGEYEPDRELTPTIILPEVVANASDGSWPNPYSNSSLADMHWFVNGKDIATLSDWTGKYTIDQVGDTRGAISISKNISPGDAVELHFEANLADPRLGVNIPIKTDKIPLTTTEKANDGYSMSIGDSNIIQYDPLKDRLALYEYKVAHGLIGASAQALADAKDKCCYLHEIPVTVYNGKTPMTTGYSIKVYRVASATSLTLLTAGKDEMHTITTTKVIFDVRLIEKASYVIKAFVGTKEVAMQEIGFSRIYQEYDCRATNGTAIHPFDTERYDKAMVDADGNIVECPGRIFKIVWYTDTYAKTAVQHNEGDETVFQLDKTGIGTTYTDDWLDIYSDCEYKPAHKVATEGSNVWTDKNGNPYIFTT